MLKLNIQKIAFVFIFGLTQVVNAITPGVRRLVGYETTANAASARSSRAILMPHLEIPLEHVGLDFAKRIDNKVAASLLFEKNGKLHVRWILNPEDTKWGRELVNHLKFVGADTNIYNYFTGYQTASRSYIVEDPQTGAQFSVKSSTNVTGGAWRDKKQPIGEALDSRLMSDFLYQQNKLRPFEHFKIMDEPAIIKIDAIDQAVVIRDLNEIKFADSNKLYLPGFSALHEEVGLHIAQTNGSNDPFKFWTDNYIKVAARALAELAARTGIQFDSPHSQNFLVELDNKMRPTGKLILRDMADLYLDSTYLEHIQGKASPLVEKFSQKENILTYVSAGFGPLHGNKKPFWVTEKQYAGWEKVFFDEYKKTLSRQFGVNIDLLKIRSAKSGDYFTANYSLTGNKQLKSIFQSIQKVGYLPQLCLSVFD